MRQVKAIVATQVLQASSRRRDRRDEVPTEGWTSQDKADVSDSMKLSLNPLAMAPPDKSVLSGEASTSPMGASEQAASRTGMADKVQLKPTKEVLSWRGSKGRRLKGIKKDSWGGGVRRALEVGRRDGRHIPGVKEDSWPFAPGSFNYKRERQLPGVNENSWRFIPDLYGPVKGPEAKRSFGGCFPDAHGKLHCESASGLHLGPSMSKLLGFEDKRRAVKDQDLDMNYGVNLLQDMKDQDLDAAAEAFGSSLSSKPASEKLLRGTAQVRKARIQNLEQVGKQCSTFLDCFSTLGYLVPHHTHPSIA